MRRWAAAVVAVLFLSTATLHVLCHSDLSERSCAVCHVSSSRVPAASPPRIAAVATAVILLAETAAPRPSAFFAAAAGARAPPALSV